MTQSVDRAHVAAVLAQGEHRRRRFTLVIAALVLALAVSATLGMSIGSVNVPFGQVWRIVGRHLAGREGPAGLGPDTIIWEIRCPRVVLGGLVGAGLALIGVAVQAMVRNPLADPYVLGVESGAAVGAVAVIFFGRGALETGPVTPTLGAFAGAMATLVIVFGLSRSGGRVSSIRLLLVGVALSYALSGLTSFFLYSTRNPSDQGRILFWIMGGLGGATWSRLPIPIGAVILGAAAIWYASRSLNALSTGDDSAVALGVDPNRLRGRLFILCSVVIAVLVSVAGPIGFVGLVVPHVGRLMVGADQRRLVPAAALLGATYLVAVDVVARIVFAPSEVPVGVVTAVLGTPFFLWLIRRRGGNVLRDAT